MKELSVFVDESGDFGEYDFHSPYYIITMVFHNQESSINEHLLKLEKQLSNIGFPSHCVHTGPIIRKEENYKNLSIEERRSIFNKLVAFTRNADIRYKCFYIEKKHINDSLEAVGKLSKQLSNFIINNYEEFLSYDYVKVYYDNGQVEVNKILSSVFNSFLPNVEFRKVIPSDFRLFQVADMLCSLKLISLKIENNDISKSEIKFFGNYRDLKRNYLRKLEAKEWF